MCPSAGLDVRYKKETCAAGGFCSHCQCIFFVQRWSTKTRVRIFFPDGLDCRYISLCLQITISRLWYLWEGWTSIIAGSAALWDLHRGLVKLDNVRWKHGMTSNTALDPSKSYDAFAYGFVYLILNFKTFSYMREDLLPLELKSWQSWHNLSWWLLIWIECIFIIIELHPGSLTLNMNLHGVGKEIPSPNRDFRFSMWIAGVSQPRWWHISQACWKGELDFLSFQSSNWNVGVWAQIQLVWSFIHPLSNFESRCWLPFTETTFWELPHLLRPMVWVHEDSVLYFAPLPLKTLNEFRVGGMLRRTSMETSQTLSGLLGSPSFIQGRTTLEILQFKMVFLRSTP